MFVTLLMNQEVLQIDIFTIETIKYTSYLVKPFHTAVCICLYLACCLFGHYGYSCLLQHKTLDSDSFLTCLVSVRQSLVSCGLFLTSPAGADNCLCDMESSRSQTICTWWHE